MAVPTGAGTETLHAHAFQDVDANQTMIYGVQHHVYTELSIVVYCESLNATTDVWQIELKTYDNHGGSSGQEMLLVRNNLQQYETYVWNDKFSFNGVEPSGTNVLSASEQIAITAQGGSNVQKINFDMTHAGDDYDVICTYLDQDWT